MTNLLWPGDQRAGDLMSDAALLASMVAVESAWLDALVAAGLAPDECAGADLAGLVTAGDWRAARGRLGGWWQPGASDWSHCFVTGRVRRSAGGFTAD